MKFPSHFLHFLFISLYLCRSVNNAFGLVNGDLLTNIHKGLKKMTRLVKILSLSVVIIVSGSYCFAQSSEQDNKNSKGKSKTVELTENPEQSKDLAKIQAREPNTGAPKVVKQVRSARPDLSKMKGARPNIVRPTGSSMPKGIGKPGGAKRPAGR